MDFIATEEILAEQSAYTLVGLDISLMDSLKSCSEASSPHTVPTTWAIGHLPTPRSTCLSGHLEPLG